MYSVSLREARCRVDLMDDFLGTRLRSTFHPISTATLSGELAIIVAATAMFTRSKLTKDTHKDTHTHNNNNIDR